MLRPLLVCLALVLATPAAQAGPCDGWGVGDLTLADAAETAFVGRLLRDRRGQLTYRVERPVSGRLKRGQRVTVKTACAVRPEGKRHVVFADGDRRVLAGREGLQAARAARLEALDAWGKAKDDARRAATLLALYHERQDVHALTLLIDAPRLLGHLDEAQRDALVRDIGRVPWGVSEAAALARLDRPMARGLLTLADRRCTDGAFDTPCARAIPEALGFLSTPRPTGDVEALAVAIRAATDRRARLRALSACEERRDERFGDPAGYGFTARLIAPERAFPSGGQAGWERAAAWCEGSSPRRR